MNAASWVMLVPSWVMLAPGWIAAGVVIGGKLTELGQPLRLVKCIAPKFQEVNEW